MTDAPPPIAGPSGHTDQTSWARKSPLAFGGVMVLIMFVLKILVSPLATNVGGADTTGPLLDNGFLLIPLSFVFLPVETFLGQAFPIWILQKQRVARWSVLCLGSAVVFGLLHLSTGPGAFLIGFAAGLVLSFCWLSWRSKSLAMAFWGTTAVHAVHNLLAISIYVVALLFE